MNFNNLCYHLFLYRETDLKFKGKALRNTLKYFNIKYGEVHKVLAP